MPLKKSGALRAAGLVAAVCGVFAMTPGTALAVDGTEECEYQETTKVFSFLGDLNDYFLAPGGDFEGQLTWTVTGKVEQRLSVLPTLGAQVLHLEGGGTIQSGAICVDATRRHLRFAVKAPKSGKLLIEAHDEAGNVTALRTLDAAEQRQEEQELGWSTTPEVPLATALAVSSGSRNVTLKIASLSGPWGVDSVHIDPYRG